MIIIALSGGGNNNTETKIAEETTVTTASTVETKSVVETTTAAEHSTSAATEPSTTESLVPAPASAEEATLQNAEPARERYVPETQATYNYSKVDQHTYVLNTKTHVFHYGGCKDVPKIKPKNHSTFTGTRDEVISNGYKACGHCRP